MIFVNSIFVLYSTYVNSACVVHSVCVLHSTSSMHLAYVKNKLRSCAFSFCFALSLREIEI